MDGGNGTTTLIGGVPPVEYENNHYLPTTKPQVTPNV